LLSARSTTSFDDQRNLVLHERKKPIAEHFAFPQWLDPTAVSRSMNSHLNHQGSLSVSGFSSNGKSGYLRPLEPGHE